MGSGTGWREIGKSRECDCRRIGGSGNKVNWGQDSYGKETESKGVSRRELNWGIKVYWEN